MANFVVDPNAVGSGYSFAPPGVISPSTDRQLDPITRDFVRTANGEWAEVADARTLVMVALELELGASPFTPEDGTVIAATRRTGDPITPEFVEAEAQRVGDALTRAGVLADFGVTVRDAAGAVLRDGSGQFVVQLTWRDLSTGVATDLTIRG